MKISFIGKFGKIYDEEYIAQSFEAIGHEVQRISDRCLTHQFTGLIDEFKPDIVLFTKFFVSQPYEVINWCKQKGIKTVSWIFDLYWDYEREDRITRTPGFFADKVFTTDGGHDEKWKTLNIDHQCVRQGIYEKECYLEPLNSPHGVVFIGSHNPLNRERSNVLEEVMARYDDFRWYGKIHTHEMRSTELNKTYATAKIVIGDSVWSPYYWSNRVVETLGRGGFLIHHDVPGIKEEYPDLVTYERGNVDQLFELIDYYMIHEGERQTIIRKNFEWVRDHYTMDKKCAELISKL